MLRRSLIERRLSDVVRRLGKAREEMRVLDEQLAALSDDADDARVRALVSETPQADRERAEAQRHVEALSRSREAQAARVAELEAMLDELLGRLAAGTR